MGYVRCIVNEPENTHHPEFDAGPRLAEAICIDDYFEAVGSLFGRGCETGRLAGSIKV